MLIWIVVDGVSVTDRDLIPVAIQMRTNVPHIFAVGDIVGPPMLAHKAAHEAHVATKVIVGKLQGNKDLASAAFNARVIPAAWGLGWLGWGARLNLKPSPNRALRRTTFGQGCWPASMRCSRSLVHCAGAGRGCSGRAGWGHSKPITTRLPRRSAYRLVNVGWLLRLRYLAGRHPACAEWCKNSWRVSLPPEGIHVF